MTMLASWLLGGLCLFGALNASALPIVPRSDAEVIETLPGGPARVEERRLRRELARAPQDAATAVQLASQLLDQSRATGDPRLAGQAMAVLQPWPEAASAPLDVLLLQATLAQYVHRFEPAAVMFEQALARDPSLPQAWLALATVRRVQGRYDAAEQACTRLIELGATLHGLACRAETDGLRGRFDEARGQLLQLLALPRLDATTRHWLATTLAELEQRAGRAAEADNAYRAALAAEEGPYALTAYADFLIEQGREADALALLRGQPRSDPVLLRLAIAGARIGAPEAATDAAEMRARIAQANLRPQPLRVHAREQAMFALWVEGQPREALALARENVAQQREPIDLLILARAARAAQADAPVRQLSQEMGLEDRRLDELL